jgi:hypothetical protein
MLGQSDGNAGSYMARLCALTAHKPAHGHGHGHGDGGKADEYAFWRELRIKGGYCCFGSWVSCVCTMDVPYGYMDTIHRQTTKMRAYLPG